MHFEFDTAIEPRGTGNVKFGLAEANGYPADILPLWVADMDFQAPPCVIEALHKRVELACPGPPCGRPWKISERRWRKIWMIFVLDNSTAFLYNKKVLF